MQTQSGEIKSPAGKTAAIALDTILAQFRDDARNNRDLGDRFERMMQQFFRVDPLYASLFSEVWMWNEWPLKGQVGDVGIDLVAQHKATGEYFAIQCKFYLPEHTLSKGDIDSFFTALGKPLFSKGIVVSTTDNWGKNALDALNQTKQVARLGIHDLEQSPIDWSKFDTRKPGQLKRTKKNSIRPHQKTALDDVMKGLADTDRGKLIMACGTGKTFTALKIAETLAPKLAGKGKPGHVLFLVPSLSLMSQTLKEWTAQSDLPMQNLAVCSDVSIGKRRVKESEDSAEITIYDLPYPATTNDKQLVEQYKKLTRSAEKSQEGPGLVVVFSTYQSLEAVSKAQKAGLPNFDLIICDEAHRTTGVTLVDQDESSFVKVHDAKFLKGTKRLYMTATPRIIKSVEDVLRDEFKSGLAEKDVHIIDPFTGTGTFLVRLLQSGLIPPDKLLHKYKNELHANEIVLLAYYIAAINIEETFHGLRQDKGKDEYLPFEGMCLTDTFQLYESGQQQIEGTFPENTARVKKQKASPIRVVIANPPYSANQGDANANNQNLDYPALDARIGETYAGRSTATNKNSIYDSYVRAIRWASDRINGKGIVGFVTNGYFIDGSAMDGLRACMIEEFSSIHVFNLRGNARTSGEIRRMEAGNVFGGGGRTPIAITLMVRNPAKKGKCALRYHDIGNYFSREEKLAIIKRFASVSGIETANGWEDLVPNKENDWINQRDPAFEKFVPMGDRDETSPSVFSRYWRGLETARDAWCYNFSKKALAANIKSTIAVFNDHAERFPDFSSANAGKDAGEAVDDFVDNDSKKISWSRAFKRDLARGKRYKFDEHAIRTSHYRPFTKLAAYVSRQLNNVVGAIPDTFPRADLGSPVICVTAAGNRGEFAVFITNEIPDLNFTGTAAACQSFPLYFYESESDSTGLQFDKSETIDGYRRRDAITDAILKTFREGYGPKVSKEDIFYYVYGILHSPEYRTRFAADLKKMLPRIPLTKEAKDFGTFSRCGRELAEWHLNYETVKPWSVQEQNEHFAQSAKDQYEYFRVTKMNFARPTPEQKAAGEKWDKTRIIYNSDVTIAKIPLEAYEYVVNGKPAIEWIMERYQYKRDPDSGIVNDPNDWCKEHKQPRYIVDLIGRVVRVSMETMKIVKQLPALNERTV